MKAAHKRQQLLYGKVPVRGGLASSFTSRRRLFGVIAVVNTAGIFAAIYMPFLPNSRALVLALVYASVCLVATALHVRQGFRVAAMNQSLAAEFRSAGIAGRPITTVALLSLVIGGFGFLSASFLLAAGYTRLVGSIETRQFTVTSSSWNPSRKYGQCFDTRFAEQPSVYQIFRAACLRAGHKAGDQVVFYGHATGLGFYLDAKLAPLAPENSLERTDGR